MTDQLRQAAQAVVERWDTPAWEWRDQGPTADLMADLRKALAQPEQEPVAWDGYNLDDMCEAFDRVIEEHHQRKNPFHDPVNKDAMIALRVLRGFVPHMKLYTTPPAAQRKPLTEPRIHKLWRGLAPGEGIEEFARAIEADHNIKEQP
jgi:hypothetical protein